jgi:hypothetical protein
MKIRHKPMNSFELISDDTRSHLYGVSAFGLLRQQQVKCQYPRQGGCVMTNGVVFASATLVGMIFLGCGSPDGSAGESIDSSVGTAEASPNAESVGSVQEALLPNCPGTGTSICSSFAGPSGGCCRCNGRYGTWRKNPPPFQTYSCACWNVCYHSSPNENWEGMCCSCNGTAGTFRLEPGPLSIYVCRP